MRRGFYLVVDGVVQPKLLTARGSRTSAMVLREAENFARIRRAAGEDVALLWVPK